MRNRGFLFTCRRALFHCSVVPLLDARPSLSSRHCKVGQPGAALPHQLRDDALHGGLDGADAARQRFGPVSKPWPSSLAHSRPEVSPRGLRGGEAGDLAESCGRGL